MAGEITRVTGRAAAPVAAPGTAIAAREPVTLAQAADAYQHTLDAKRRYVATLAASSLLPPQYRQNPPNVLWALEYGETLGISPMAAIMGIHVIEGKPSAGAGLISGLVRKAGHKLRVKGDEKSATCTIIRYDDPEYEFTFTWTMERARTAKLTGKQVWQNYPAAMLMARAITEAARAACQDVLYGLAYTPEELGADSLDGTDWVAPEVPAEEMAGKDQQDEISHHLDRLKITDKLAACAMIADREHLTSAADLTSDEAAHIITELEGCEGPEAFVQLWTELVEARPE